MEKYLHNVSLAHQWIFYSSGFQTCPAHFVCLPYQTHLIQLISSLVETARPELQVKGACRTGLKTTALQ